MRLPVSVFIIAVDEADRIARTIESVRDWADEVIVIDSGSRDDTVKVSAEAGARVMFNNWPGYGEQKRFGESQCRNDWLLNLDADEVVSAKLGEEIRELFASGTPPGHGAYYVDIVEILPGRAAPGRFAHKVHAIRLYDRRSGRFDPSTVHDTVRMEKGTAGALRAIIEHRASRGITHTIAKINRYSTMQAEDMVKRGLPPFFALRLLIEFPLGFFKAYIFRAYCLKGFYGFINAMNYGYSRFVRLAKAWELEHRS